MTLKPEQYRELDALIAEHVFGFIWYYIPARNNDLRFLVPKNSLRLTPARRKCTPAQKAKMEPYTDALRDVPNYSTDRHHAMDVYFELCRDGRWCCITLKGDYAYNWDVFLTYASHNDMTPNMSNAERKKLMKKHEVTTHVNDQELPLAIVRAALHAHGVKYETK